MSNDRCVIGIDLGGTKIAGAVFALANGNGAGEAGHRLAAADDAPWPKPLAVAERPTLAQEGPEAGTRQLLAVVEELVAASGGRKLAGVGIGSPGPLDAQAGLILDPPNLPGWHQWPLVRLVREAVGVPVVLDNDANLAALGEHRFGAGRGTQHMFYVTLGTGIGGAAIVGGQLYRGHTGGAGEVGHIRVEPGEAGGGGGAAEAPLCSCGHRGCVEAYAAGWGIAKAAGARDAGEVFAAADSGDARAQAVLAMAAAALGRGLAAACTLFDPEVVVAGGGMAMAAGRAADSYFAAVERTMREAAFGQTAGRVAFVRARLGRLAGTLGAAALVLDELPPPPQPPRVVEKPWGREVWWAQTQRYVGKVIEVKAGASLSLQYHRQKLETMLFVAGEGTMVLGDEVVVVRPGTVLTIPAGTVHRVSALTDLTFYEVSTPEVQDVVRLRDDYGRADTPNDQIK